MEITQIIKRDYETSPFVLNKISNAIEKAMISVGNGTKEDANTISVNVLQTLLERKGRDHKYLPTVEEVQDLVEDKLMESAFHDVAKAYILYRDEQARSRKTNIFEKRINLKPYEYPQLNDYVDAIRHSYWIHTEFNFTSDIQDFKTRLIIHFFIKNNQYIHILIVDDEPKAIQSLIWELSSFSKEIEVIASYTNPNEALNFLEKHAPDCLFLDVQMPTMGGFQFLEQLTNIDFAVVITTAYDEYAIKALKHEAIDYLLKPIDSDDLRESIDKIKKHSDRTINSIKLERMLSNFNSQFDKKRITVNTDGKLLFLDLDDIIYIESDGNYSTIYLQDQKKLLLLKN